MIRIGICDDEAEQRQELEKMVYQVVSNQSLSVNTCEMLSE